MHIEYESIMERVCRAADHAACNNMSISYIELTSFEWSLLACECNKAGVSMPVTKPGKNSEVRFFLYGVAIK